MNTYRNKGKTMGIWDKWTRSRTKKEGEAKKPPHWLAYVERTFAALIILVVLWEYGIPLLLMK